jgi:hypothetical protein
MTENEIKEFHQYLVESGIVMDLRNKGYYIIPAPCFSDDVLKLLEEGVVEARREDVGVEPESSVGLDVIVSLCAFL